MYENDTEPRLSPTRAMSLNGKKALDVWDQSVRVVDGHYELDIPFKQVQPDLSNSKIMAKRKLEFPRRKMAKNPEFGIKYRSGMQAYIDEGYAE